MEEAVQGKNGNWDTTCYSNPGEDDDGQKWMEMVRWVRWRMFFRGSSDSTH